MSSLTVARWSEHEFMSSAGQWGVLLAASDADRLFLSWDWQSLWWRLFGSPQGLELLLLAAHDRQGQLVGLAPLFVARSSKANLLNITRIEFMGNIWRGTGTVRTEYLDFIAKDGMKTAVVSAFLDYLSSSLSWDELVFTDLDKSHETYGLLTNGRLLPECTRRYPEDFKSFYVDTTGRFEDYLKSLGSKTRLKLYNRRKYLKKLGKVTLEYANADNIDRFFEVLNELHRLRWEKKLYEGPRLEFHRRLCEKFLEQNAVNFCLLCIDGTPQSALYNIRLAGRDYGIQSGFNDNFDKKVTLGALHYGFMIESAFQDDDIAVFDFLAGDGKATDYKNHFTPAFRDLGVVQVIQRPLLKVSYRCYDWLKRAT